MSRGEGKAGDSLSFLPQAVPVLPHPPPPAEPRLSQTCCSAPCFEKWGGKGLCHIPLEEMTLWRM